MALLGLRARGRRSDAGAGGDEAVGRRGGGRKPVSSVAAAEPQVTTTTGRPAPSTLPAMPGRGPDARSGRRAGTKTSGAPCALDVSAAVADGQVAPVAARAQAVRGDPVQPVAGRGGRRRTRRRRARRSAPVDAGGARQRRRSAGLPGSRVAASRPHSLRPPTSSTRQDEHQDGDPQSTRVRASDSGRARRPSAVRRARAGTWRPPGRAAPSRRTACSRDSDADSAGLDHPARAAGRPAPGWPARRRSSGRPWSVSRPIARGRARTSARRRRPSRAGRCRPWCSTTTDSAVSSPIMPERGRAPLAFLVLAGVRRVVGGDDVDRAVGQRRRAAPRRRSAVRSGGLTLKTGS